MDVRKAELTGFGQPDKDMSKTVTVTMTERQKRFISDAVADIFTDGRRSARDRVEAIGVQRVLEGKEWTDDNRAKAVSIVDSNRGVDPGTLCEEVFGAEETGGDVLCM